LNDINPDIVLTDLKEHNSDNKTANIM